MIKNITINIHSFAGSFAENKDKAKYKREKQILPELEKGNTIILDYKDVNSTTQSFTHAMISEAMRIYGVENALERILFKNCNDNVKRIISIVVEYMQRRLVDR